MSIVCEHIGRIAIVRMQRPEARNAVHPAMAQALFEAFMQIEANPDIDVAILTGDGGHFCAGFDLKTAADGRADAWIKSVDIAPDWADPVADPIAAPMGPSRLLLSKPVIAAVEGYAVAGGLELAAWCDMRVAGRSAVFGVFCRRWGVPLIDGGTVRLPRILGQGRANDMILTGRPVEAEEAYHMGLVDRLVESGQALNQALELAQSLCDFPQGCLRADHLSARPDPAQLAADLKREWRSAALFGAEGRAGATRFSEGRGRHGVF